LGNEGNLKKFLEYCPLKLLGCKRLETPDLDILAMAAFGS
jgi:hypothetical protein